MDICHWPEFDLHHEVCHWPEFDLRHEACHWPEFDCLTIDVQKRSNILWSGGYSVYRHFQKYFSYSVESGVKHHNTS